MDLLGSILSTMDKPPEADEKQKELIKSMYRCCGCTNMRTIIRIIS